MIETFCQLQRPSSCNQDAPPIMNTVLEGIVRLRESFHLGHVKMLQVGVIHKEGTHQVEWSLGYGADQMNSMPLPPVGLDHCDASDGPPGQCCPNSLTQTLRFLIVGQVSICFRVPKASSKEKPHILYHGKQ